MYVYVLLREHPFEYHPCHHLEGVFASLEAAKLGGLIWTSPVVLDWLDYYVQEVGLPFDDAWAMAHTGIEDVEEPTYWVSLTTDHGESDFCIEKVQVQV